MLQSPDYRLRFRGVYGICKTFHVALDGRSKTFLANCDMNRGYFLFTWTRGWMALLSIQDRMVSNCGHPHDAIIVDFTIEAE